MRMGNSIHFQLMKGRCHLLQWLYINFIVLQITGHTLFIMTGEILCDHSVLSVSSNICCSLAAKLPQLLPNMPPSGCLSPVTVAKLTWPARTYSILLALCEGIPPVTGGFPSQRASNTENISMSLWVAVLWDHSALLTCWAVGGSLVA